MSAAAVPARRVEGRLVELLGCDVHGEADLEHDPRGREVALGRCVHEHVAVALLEALEQPGIRGEDGLHRRAVGAPQRAEQLVGGGGAGGAEQVEQVGAPAPDGQRGVAERDRRPVGEQELYVRAGAVARQRGLDHPLELGPLAFLLRHTALQQQPQPLDVVVAQHVPQRVGTADVRAGVQQQQQARVVAALAGVVERLVVVRRGPALEQQRRHARLVGDPRGAVECAERAELRVLPGRVRVGAGVEQQPGAVEQVVGALGPEQLGVGHMEQREPGPFAQRPVDEARIGREGAFELYSVPPPERFVEAVHEADVTGALRLGSGACRS